MSEPHDALRTAQRLRVAVDRLRRVVRQTSLPEGLSRTEEATLSRLERGGPLTTAELAHREGLRPQTMGTTVRALVERGLAAKQPDPNDGRREQVSVTAEGLTVMASINVKRDRDLAALLERELSAAQLRRLLETIGWLEELGNRL